MIDIVTLRERKEIGLKSLHESIDTTSSAGKLIFHIFGALAEFERTLIREHTQAGLQAARARGRKGGRPKALSADQQALAVKLYDEKQHTIAQICRILGISKPTLYNYPADAPQREPPTPEAHDPDFFVLSIAERGNPAGPERV